MAGVDTAALQPGRDRAAMALVAGYEAAVAALHPDDGEEREWYGERLSDARLIAEAEGSEA